MIWICDWGTSAPVRYVGFIPIRILVRAAVQAAKNHLGVFRIPRYHEVRGSYCSELLFFKNTLIYLDHLTV